MDQWIATIVVTIITGIFSIVTIVVQKQQDKAIKRIDEQSKIAQKEKELREVLNEKRMQLGILANDMMILVLNTNLLIIDSVDKGEDVSREVKEIRKESQKLVDKYDNVRAELDEIVKTHDVIEDLNDDFNPHRR